MSEVGIGFSWSLTRPFLCWSDPFLSHNRSTVTLNFLDNRHYCH
uniref:Uncharacterized protein n=1 Tax=Rhizophora mucronata TaxID=61149 RepID=A0A2P2NK82_RHIMU